jgi:hypothetical protein
MIMHILNFFKKYINYGLCGAMGAIRAQSGAMYGLGRNGRNNQTFFSNFSYIYFLLINFLEKF